MKSLKRQQGMSLIGVALLAFLIIFFGTLIVKMSGSYMDNYTIDKTIEANLEIQMSGRFDYSEFVTRLDKTLNINNVSFDTKESLTYSQKSSPAKVILSYEERVHLFFNVDVIMSFNKEYEL